MVHLFPFKKRWIISTTSNKRTSFCRFFWVVPQVVGTFCHDKWKVATRCQQLDLAAAMDVDSELQPLTVSVRIPWTSGCVERTGSFVKWWPRAMICRDIIYIYVYNLFKFLFLSFIDNICQHPYLVLFHFVILTYKKHNTSIYIYMYGYQPDPILTGALKGCKEFKIDWM